MNFWDGKKILVTGASGLIGGYLCKALIDEGAIVTGYDMNIHGTLPWHGLHRDVFPDRVNGDILNYDMLHHFIQDKEFVFHLAANSGVEESRMMPRKSLDLNVMGTVNVLEACQHVPTLKAVTIASSNHIYGEQDEYPVSENAPLNQLDTYSVSKVCADYIARMYAHNYGTPAVIIRNTNCYGPYDPHIKHIIPSAILSALRGQQPVIKGTGDTKKGYLFTTDVAAGIMDAAEWSATHEAKGEVFNLSTDRISVSALVGTILTLTGSDLEPKILGSENDQNDEDLDWSKAKNLFGWEPKISLEDGLKATIDWIRDRDRNGNSIYTSESELQGAARKE